MIDMIGEAGAGTDAAAVAGIEPTNIEQLTTLSDHGTSHVNGQKTVMII